MKKKCAMCHSTYETTEGLPPCTVRFFGMQYYADLCYACGARVAKYIKRFRQNPLATEDGYLGEGVIKGVPKGTESWSQYVT